MIDNQVRNMYNYEDNRTLSPEKSTLPSLTVPDQSLPLKELIKRHASGREITSLTGIYQKDGNYDELLEHVERMSEMDRIEYSRQLKAEVQVGLKLWESNKAARAALAKQKQEDADAAVIAQSEADRLKDHPPTP